MWGIEFQFPTGWNSTSLSLDIENIAVFQFPTGWNSTNLSNLNSLIFVVSIPNGMEFYHRLSDRSAIFRKFQFPTGWNSTMCN